jgi:protein-S-isoprenylcysteine O-methyltransferase Ste14
MGDPDHNLRDFRLTTGLLGLGAIFYFVPYVLGVQANSVAQGPLASISNFLVTSSNPGWAVGIAYVSIALLAIMGAIAAGYTLKTGGRAEVQEPASSN